MFSETKQPPCQVSHPRPAASSLPRARRVGGQRCGQEAEASPEGIHTRCSSTSAAAGVPALCLQSPCLHEALDRTRPSDPRTLGHSTGGSREPSAPGKERPVLFFWV